MLSPEAVQETVAFTKDLFGEGNDVAVTATKATRATTSALRTPIGWRLVEVKVAGEVRGKASHFDLAKAHRAAVIDLTRQYEFSLYGRR